MNDDALDASTGRQPGRGLDELLHVVYLSRAAAGTDPEKWLPELGAMRGPATMRRRFVACSPTAAAGSCNGWKVRPLPWWKPWAASLSTSATATYR